MTATRLKAAKAAGPGKVPSLAWIRPLAEPYLRGFRPSLQGAGSLRGYWFRRFASEPAAGARSPRATLGFFVGYLLDIAGYRFLDPRPPECLVFAFVDPVGGALHQRLVEQPDSLLPKTFAYIRWLTHRPPRFVFHADQSAALVRHISMCGWPPAEYQHLSRNFFIETLAWLVRSAVVRKLLAESAGPSAAK